MQLTTPRLTLRPADLTMLASTHAYAGNLENTRFMMFLPYATEEETADMLRAAEAEWQKPLPAQYEFAVFLGDAHIGSVFSGCVPRNAASRTIRRRRRASVVRMRL